MIKFLSTKPKGEPITADEVIIDGGMPCGNCGEWRILLRRTHETPVIEQCGNCHDEEFDLYSIEDDGP